MNMEVDRKARLRHQNPKKTRTDGTIEWRKRVGVEETNLQTKACALNALQTHILANRYRRYRAFLHSAYKAWNSTARKSDR